MTEQAPASIVYIDPAPFVTCFKTKGPVPALQSLLKAVGSETVLNASSGGSISIPDVNVVSVEKDADGFLIAGKAITNKGITAKDRDLTRAAKLAFAALMNIGQNPDGKPAGIAVRGKTFFIGKAPAAAGTAPK